MTPQTGQNQAKKEACQGVMSSSGRLCRLSVAERVGFEPTYRLLTGNSISSRARYGQLRYLSAQGNLIRNLGRAVNRFPCRRGPDAPDMRACRQGGGSAAVASLSCLSLFGSPARLDTEERRASRRESAGWKCRILPPGAGGRQCVCRGVWRGQGGLELSACVQKAGSAASGCSGDRASRAD